MRYSQASADSTGMTGESFTRNSEPATEAL